MNWWEAPEWGKSYPMNFARRDDGPTAVLRVERDPDDQKKDPRNEQRPYEYIRVFV